MENYERKFDQDINSEAELEFKRLDIEKENEIGEFIEGISDEEFDLEFEANPKTPGEIMNSIFDLLDVTDCKKISHRRSLRCNGCKYRKISIVAEKNDGVYGEETVLHVKYKKKTGNNQGKKDYTIKYRKGDNKIIYKDNKADNAKEYTYKSNIIDNNKEIIDVLNVVYILLKRCGVGQQNTAQ